MPTRTIMPLEYLREEISYHPYFFYQLANAQAPLTSQCNSLVKEFGWQGSDAAGRENIRQAIKIAENKARKYLTYDIGTKYNSETIDVGFLKQIGSRNRLPGASFGSWWGNGSCGAFSTALATLQVGKLQNIGTVVQTKLGNAAVSFYDSDNDGLLDTFQADFANNTAAISLCSVYVSDTDKPLNQINNPLAEWEIRPVTFSRPNVNTIRVTGPVWLVVLPAKYGGVGNPPGTNYNQFGTDSSGSLDPNDPANFIGSVDFYLKSYTGVNTATLVWQNGSTASSATLTATIVDTEAGQVQLDFGSSSPIVAACTGPNVQYVTINYEAGADIDEWRTTVTRLALAELRNRICGCESMNSEVLRWQQDMAMVSVARNGGESGEGFRVSNHNLGNPLGTRRGQVEAWNVIGSKQLLRAYKP